MPKGAPVGSSGPAPADARHKPKIGRYVVVSRLGRGGMGMVYRCLDETLDREVALKTLTAEGTLDDENRARFEIEAKAAAKLQHPNIVTVFELGEDRGIPFIAMELLPGFDLESLLRSGEALPLHEKLDIVIQVCRGLAYAHDHRIVHRDIKPSNIRLLDDGTVKIMDFGIAKLGGTNVTRSGMMVGTMNYMSPEQIRGLPLDGRSDVFSLGVILFQILAGHRPFVGKGGPDVLYKIVQDETPPLGVDLGNFGPRLEAIVRRALEKEPDKRYASATDLAADLTRVSEDYARARVPALAEAETKELLAARRALKEGKPEETLRRAESVLAKSPEALEARRLARSARRERERRAKPDEGVADVFPELEATYQAQRTERTPDTLVGRKAAPAEPAPAETRTALWLLPAVAVLLVAAIGTGVLLLRGRGTQPATKPASEKTSLVPQPPGPTKTQTPAKPALARLSVETDPAGATLLLDGQKIGTTPAELQLDPSKDQKLSVSREGFVSQEVKLAAGYVPPSLRLTLEPSGPPGTVVIAATYPIDVASKGRVLAKGESAPRVSLPPGRHTLQVVSASHFLRREIAVEVKSGASQSFEMPGLGKINIKANPDNCEILIDGAFVDYPPILDRAIVEGGHTVTFKWPDGAKRDEAVQVSRGGIAYVMGRRE